jgi:hypothetical protein
MSIATDEAEKKYPAPTDADDPMYKYMNSIDGYPFVKRQGYIDGRTAEVTEAEIEAAANRLYEVTHAPEADPGWYAISKIKRETYREQAAMMLEAARKAVLA